MCVRERERERETGVGHAGKYLVVTMDWYFYILFTDVSRVYTLVAEKRLRHALLGRGIQ